MTKIAKWLIMVMATASITITATGAGHTTAPNTRPTVNCQISSL